MIVLMMGSCSVAWGPSSGSFSDMSQHMFCHVMASLGADGDC